MLVLVSTGMGEHLCAGQPVYEAISASSSQWDGQSAVRIIHQGMAHSFVDKQLDDR